MRFVEESRRHLVGLKCHEMWCFLLHVRNVFAEQLLDEIRPVAIQHNATVFNNAVINLRHGQFTSKPMVCNNSSLFFHFPALRSLKVSEPNIMLNWMLGYSRFKKTLRSIVPMRMFSGDTPFALSWEWINTTQIAKPKKKVFANTSRCICKHSAFSMSLTSTLSPYTSYVRDENKLVTSVMLTEWFGEKAN
jgi:hypothetical protein